MKKATFCFLIIVVWQLSNFVCGVIPAKERAALIALYNSTDGDVWLGNYGWKDDPLHTDGFAMPGTEEYWKGVTTSGDHVTGLDLHCNALRGKIPPELGNLSHLEGLKLDNDGSLSWARNNLIGSIPPELGNLSHLEWLELGGNSLNGSIPSGLCNLSKLVYLELEYNQLCGEIPSQLGNLSNLQTLNLGWNLLDGSIPSELGKLSNLTELFLNNNQLSGDIPSSLMNLIGIRVLNIGYNCLSATDSALREWLNINDWDWEASQSQCGEKTSKISLNRSSLKFKATTEGEVTDPQTVLISNSGSGVLNWKADVSTYYLSVTPSSGTGDMTISVRFNNQYLAGGVGLYFGLIEISDPNAINSPQTIYVSMFVYGLQKTSAPFGEFTTPHDGSSVYNSIPVTGWALDDIGVANVKIYNGDAYIGDAVFMEGARPDVEAAYPGYPNNYKAGWGYMLLTHFLPNGGNGTYTLVAKATDLEGNEVTLGSKTITIDNAHAVKPFGAIDTPAQGGIATGSNYLNYGWALAPPPNTIPTDGSTIQVWVDGVSQGDPVYNQYRQDVAALFPGYINSSGAGGWFQMDTTAYENGIHTISWSVSDNAGNIDGIGSRYFSIQNLSVSGEQGAGTQFAPIPPIAFKSPLPQNTNTIFTDSFNPLFLQKGYNPEGALETLCPDENGQYTIEIKELERLVIYLDDLDTPGDSGHYQGCLVKGDQLKPLPIGSTLDAVRGIFYWQPGPGFLGDYELVFIKKTGTGEGIKKHIILRITPHSG